MSTSRTAAGEGGWVAPLGGHRHGWGGGGDTPGFPASCPAVGFNCLVFCPPTLSPTAPQHCMQHEHPHPTPNRSICLDPLTPYRWRGDYGGKKQLWFPANYVEEIVSTQAQEQDEAVSAHVPIHPGPRLPKMLPALHQSGPSSGRWGMLLAPTTEQSMLRGVVFFSAFAQTRQICRAGGRLSNGAGTGLGPMQPPPPPTAPSSFLSCSHQKTAPWGTS